MRLGLWGLLRRGGGNPGHSAWIEPHPPAHGRRGREAAPPNLSRALRALWSEPGFFKTLAVNHALLPLCAAELGGRQIPPGIPVTVLSGAHQPPERLAEHAAMATRHVVVDGCAHWIHLDHPDIVSAAIRQVGHR